MKKLLLREAAKHKLQNRRRKRWQKTVSILACLVVFCTVYALILPALTAEADIYCGKEEHTHTEDCYEDKLICGQEEAREPTSIRKPVTEKWKLWSVRLPNPMVTSTQKPAIQKNRF